MLTKTLYVYSVYTQRLGAIVKKTYYSETGYPGMVAGEDIYNYNNQLVISEAHHLDR